jgi:5-bromo-4-chloroindolyl phosphate hydrolysis protein
MITLLLTYLKKPVAVPKYLFILLLLGCMGFFGFWIVYDRSNHRAEQYDQLNTFLESRIKELQGERTALEISLQDAIDKGLNETETVREQYEKALKNNRYIVDSLSLSEHEKLFQSRYGTIRQYPKRQRK